MHHIYTIIHKIIVKKVVTNTDICAMIYQTAYAGDGMPLIFLYIHRLTGGAGQYNNKEKVEQ